jgi:hypothetical protein
VTVLKAHFDGKVLVPDEAVDLPVNRPLEVSVVAVDELAAPRKPLARLAKRLAALPDEVTQPTDAAAQLDHYLYGLPKRP